MASLPTRCAVYVRFTSGRGQIAGLVEYGGIKIFANQRRYSDDSWNVQHFAPSTELALKYCRQFGDPHEIQLVWEGGKQQLILSPKEFAERFVPFKRPNLWIEHVKETHRQHGGTYQQAMQLAKKTWTVG